MTSQVKNNNKINSTDEVLTYKNRRLVRNGDLLCYGNEDDKYIVLMEIINKKNINGNQEVGNKISVAMFEKQEFIKNPNATFLNICERYGLYDALETASMWMAKENNLVEEK